MKILMISDSLRGGGTERRLLETIRGLLQIGYQVKLVVLNTLNQYPESENIGIEIIMIKRVIKKDPAIFWKLVRICKRFRPDVIHSWGSMASVYALPVSKLFRIKFVNSMINTAECKRYSPRWWRAKITFPFSDKILSNSFAGLKSFNPPPVRSKVIHNGFDFNRLNNLLPGDEVKRKFGIQTRYVVGMVAMVDHRKDYHTFINAAEEVLKHNEDVTFLCVGDGLLLAKMKEITSGNPKIRFVGRQGNIESVINIFDIGVLTTNSSRGSEGISNSILEYMAMGKPVIATDGGGSGEIILNGSTGYLVPSFSPGILAEKIQQLLSDEETRNSLGANGQKRIKESFSFESMISSFDQIYLELV